jgi:DNA-binding NtrC family response regulator
VELDFSDVVGNGQSALLTLGNVRELHNTLERAVLMSDKERIDDSLLSRLVGDRNHSLRRVGNAKDKAAEGSNRATRGGDDVGGAGRRGYDETMRDFERSYLIDALRDNGGRVTETAAQIGLSRATLYRRIAALGIEV